ncbi:MAG: AraC family transcriptional regulator, partial [Deltaproteobacteria bacterium]|nr:AraC family transcriptional regulator [Deltaproteobacteria bacterium]
GVDTEMRSYAWSDELMLLYCRYGGHIELEAPALPFTLLQTPIAGTSRMQRCGQTVDQDVRLGSMVDAGHDITVRFTPEAESLATIVEPAALSRMLGTLLGRHPTSPIAFELGSRIDATQTEGVHDLVRMLARQIDSNSPVLASPLARKQIADHLLLQILYGQPHSYSKLLHRAPAAPAPRHVRRVEEHIEAHAEQPIRLEDLVAVSGVSARSLQVGFRRFRGTTPMGHLRRVRLHRAREQLASSDPSVATVTEIALRWGFPSLGRFSQNYRRIFGETPSQTLRAARPTPT